MPSLFAMHALLLMNLMLHASNKRHSWLSAQVYYAPRQPVYCQVTLPTIFGGFQLLRVILIREGITLVHAHQAFSVMGHEAILHARTMGYKVKHMLEYWLTRLAICHMSLCVHAVIDIQNAFSRVNLTGQLVGGHSITSAWSMQVVFTDHSLFGFADASSILTNKVLKFSLADVHEVSISWHNGYTA